MYFIAPSTIVKGNEAETDVATVHRCHRVAAYRLDTFFNDFSTTIANPQVTTSVCSHGLDHGYSKSPIVDPPR